MFRTFTLGGKYKVQQKLIGQGVSSTVMSGINIITGKKVAIKKITHFLDNKHQSLRALRQMILLRCLDHPNIVSLNEVIIEGQECKELYLVLEYMPSDIRKLFKSVKKPQEIEIKGIIFQILCALDYCNQCQVLHRDLKPENILITQDYSQVKLCDFGLARAVINEDYQQECNKSQQKQKDKNKYGLSAHVTTRWYRAPQLILLQGNYNNQIDIWSVACILGELLGMLPQNATTFMQRKALFPGKACYPLSPPKGQINYQKVNDFPHSVHDQLSVIFDILGTPTDISFITDVRARNYLKSFGKRDRTPFSKIYQYLPNYAEDFLNRALQFNPKSRLTIQQAINHPLFNQIRNKFQQNFSIKGQPISMELEELSIDAIKNMAVNETKHYVKTLQEKLSN